MFLSWSERKQADINSKNIWMIYFQNPKSDSLNFIIENHSDKKDFEYTIFEDKNALRQEKLSVQKGEAKLIQISERQSGKFTVQVRNNGNKKEIYKNL